MNSVAVQGQLLGQRLRGDVSGGMPAADLEVQLLWDRCSWLAPGRPRGPPTAQPCGPPQQVQHLASELRQAARRPMPFRSHQAAREPRDPLYSTRARRASRNKNRQTVLCIICGWLLFSLNNLTDIDGLPIVLEPQWNRAVAARQAGDGCSPVMRFANRTENRP
jgi:hypothetical protein